MFKTTLKALSLAFSMAFIAPALATTATETQRESGAPLTAQIPAAPTPQQGKNSVEGVNRSASTVPRRRSWLPR